MIKLRKNLAVTFAITGKTKKAAEIFDEIAAIYAELAGMLKRSVK